jgi:hypothetical protein
MICCRVVLLDMQVFSATRRWYLGFFRLRRTADFLQRWLPNGSANSGGVVKLSRKTTSLVRQRIFALGEVDIRSTGWPAFRVTTFDSCGARHTHSINQHLVTLRDAAGSLLVQVRSLVATKANSI